MTPLKTRSFRNITPPVVAEWLNVETETVLKWIHSGDLPALNIGTKNNVPRFRIFKKDLTMFMAKRGLPVETIQDLVSF